MKKIFPLLIVLALLLPFIIAQKPANQHQKAYVDGELIIQLKPDVARSSGLQIEELQRDFNQIGLNVIKPLSTDYLGLWLMSFDGDRAADEVVLHAIQSHKNILNAQFNHFIELRENVPNDEYFALQWSMKNTGQTGGLDDADIDATEAWDLTTGGETVTGDTIVIAIIDNGFLLEHGDLDFFVNTDEIPDNLIDDDGNGYIDDYKGWNAYTTSGNITAQDHGTHVSGIAAARGNNEMGVAGVNWNAKVMAIQGSSTLESVAVAAYAYAHAMRLLYDESDGEKGAFIVSTNASFGVNNGQPEDYPIWGAMYDSLGALGVLSAGATANASVNVDEVGDIPTAFDSPWLITVTNTTDDDEKANSGYGATTIDLGAPGTSVYSTRQNGGWGYKTGTSMACPHVAGAIALMFAAAPESFMNEYFNDPANVALQIKQYILDGTDPIEELNGITVTGGRLNINNSLMFFENPGVSISPSSLEAVLPLNTTTTDTFFIRNASDSDVPFSINTENFPDWLSVTPATGVVPEGDTLGIEVGYDATGLDQATYIHTMSVAVGEQSFFVQVRLVTPLVAYSRQEVTMYMMPDMVDDFSIVLQNNDVSELDYTLTVIDSPGWLETDPEAGLIPGNGYATFELLFNSDGLDDGTYSSKVLVSYLDQNDTIDVTLITPSFMLSPDALLMNLGPSSSDYREIVIINQTPDPIPYSIDFDDQPIWMQLNPVSGTIEGNSRDTLRADFTSFGLSEATYTTYFEFNTDIVDFAYPIELNVIYFGIGEHNNALKAFSVFPNPFSDQSQIVIGLDRACALDVAVYDLQGKCIRTLAERDFSAGEHRLTWDGHSMDGNQLPAGVYYLRISGDVAASKKIILQQ